MCVCLLHMYGCSIPPFCVSPPHTTLLISPQPVSALTLDLSCVSVWQPLLSLECSGLCLHRVFCRLLRSPPDEDEVEDEDEEEDEEDEEEDEEEE